jgi:hypothetical protein
MATLNPPVFKIVVFVVTNWPTSSQKPMVSGTVNAKKLSFVRNGDNSAGPTKWYS